MSSGTSAESRKGPRIPIKVPVVIDGKDVSGHHVREEGETLLVNDAGALLALGAEFQLQDLARVTNCASGGVAECRIAWRSSSKINERWSYGIALLGEPNNFWELKNS
ncbi:MAG: hypothetical protein HY046_07860 [Acidobacteria bacterium]|nr:hypothetical protein [Acidobacteriota bacterium]